MRGLSLYLRVATWTLGCVLSLPAIAGDPAISSSNPSPGHSDKTDPADIVEDALERGDDRTLYKLFQTSSDPAMHALAAMALERVHWNLDKSSEDARLCERVLSKSKPDVALYCADFAAGNLRLAGKAQEASREDLAIAQRYGGRADTQYVATLKTFAQASLDLPDMRAARPEQTVELPLVKTFGRDGPYVDVKVNGHTVRLLLDTGASTLLIDDQTAKAWGVHFDPDQQQYTRGYLAKKIPIRTGWVDQLDLGHGLVVTHVPVDVESRALLLIGFDVLRQFGAFRLSSDRLVIYGSEDHTRPACEDPLLISSAGRGRYTRWVIGASVGGEVQPTLVDSGASFYFNGNAAALAHYKNTLTGSIGVLDASSREQHTGVKVVTQQLVISGQPMKMSFIVTTDDNLAWPYTLGNLALKDMDFYADFDTRHGCMLMHAHLR